MHLLAWRATRNPNDNDYRIRFGDDRVVSSEPSRCFQEYSTEAVSSVSTTKLLRFCLVTRRPRRSGRQLK